MRRVEASRREVAREGGPERWAGGARHRRRERAERETEEGEKGSICNFQNFQGPKCKTRITFKLKLKWKSAQHESCSIFQDLQL